MIEIFNDTTNITEYLERNSYRETDELNNRRNTATFNLLQNEVAEGSPIYVYDGIELTQDASSGQAVLNVKDTYQDTDKFRVGDILKAYPRTANEKEYTILSIDHSAKTITLTSNLTANVTMSDKIGKLRFAGTVQISPQKEIGVTGTFEYKVTVTDWGNLFNRKNVVDIFENMWGREIMGRICYSFVAMDTELSIDKFESAWTESGVALAMSDETDDRIEGQKSQKAGTSGSGEALWTLTPTAVDISSYTHLRWWWKVAENNGSKVTAMKIRVGQDASNYYEYNLSNIGEDYEDCWNFESVKLNNPDSTTGTPNLTAVDWIQISVTCNALINSDKILFDKMLVTTGGFTLQNVKRGLVKLNEVRANHKKPTVVVEDIHKIQNLFWYIDYEKDIHSFAETDNPAPYSITDTSENYSDLIITADISKLVNRQTVRGGEAPSETQFTEEFVADGFQTTWNLAYKPSQLQIFVDTTGTGSSYVEKTVGVENFADESVIDFVYAFLEKTARNANHATLSDGDLIKFVYYPYLPIRVQVVDHVSAAAMKLLTGGDGIYDGEPIIDLNLKTFDDARRRAQAEVDAYSNAKLTATYKSEREGLRAGMVLTVTDSSRSISAQEFLVQKVISTTKNAERFRHSITAGSTLYGIIEFLQWLIKKQGDLDSDIEELVDVIISDDETITINVNFDLSIDDNEYFSGEEVGKWWDFVDNVGSISENGHIRQGLSYSFWYVKFNGSESGTAEFDKSTNHNNGTALKLTTTIGGSGNSLELTNYKRLLVRNGESYTFGAWVEILSSLTNVGTGGGLKIELLEYENMEGGSVLATQTLLTGYTTVGDFHRITPVSVSSFNASTNWIEIVITLDQCIGVVSVADMYLVENSLTEPMAGFLEAS